MSLAGVADEGEKGAGRAPPPPQAAQMAGAQMAGANGRGVGAQLGECSRSSHLSLRLKC